MYGDVAVTGLLGDGQDGRRARRVGVPHGHDVTVVGVAATVLGSEGAGSSLGSNCFGSGTFGSGHCTYLVWCGPPDAALRASAYHTQLWWRNFREQLFRRTRIPTFRPEQANPLIRSDPPERSIPTIRPIRPDLPILANLPDLPLEQIRMRMILLSTPGSGRRRDSLRRDERGESALA